MIKSYNNDELIETFSNSKMVRQFSKQSENTSEAGSTIIPSSRDMGKPNFKSQIEDTMSYLPKTNPSHNSNKSGLETDTINFSLKNETINPMQNKKYIFDRRFKNKIGQFEYNNSKIIFKNQEGIDQIDINEFPLLKNGKNFDMKTKIDKDFLEDIKKRFDESKKIKNEINKTKDDIVENKKEIDKIKQEIDKIKQEILKEFQRKIYSKK